jgi:acetyltransferase-like isoleucine patch superfamily enzyme
MGELKKAKAILDKMIKASPDQALVKGLKHTSRLACDMNSDAVSQKKHAKIALPKKTLLEILRKACYAPHPETRVGKLNLSQEIFATHDRETNVIISPKARIDITGDVSIGAWTMIGEGTKILTHDHYHEGPDKPLLLVQEEKGVKWKSLMIGKDVWLHGCTVLYQVTDIPEGVVVGAGAVLTKNPGPYEIWAGNPARKVGER